MPFSKILDEAMRLVRRSFRTVYAPVAIPLTLISGATGVFQALWVQSMAQDAGATMPTFSIETIILAMVGGIALGLGMVALQKAAVDVTAGRLADMKEAWRFALKPSVVGTLLLLALATIGSALFCFFPILYVAPLLSLTTPIMATEGLFGPKALSRSAELTQYNPQNRFLETPLVKALGLMVVTVVLSYAVAFVVVIPFQIPMYIDIFRKAASGQEPSVGVMAKWIWLQVPSQILQMLATVAVYAYSSFGYALLFFDARNRKEGSDLAQEINTVFGPGPAAGEPAP